MTDKQYITLWIIGFIASALILHAHGLILLMIGYPLAFFLCEEMWGDVKFIRRKKQKMRQNADALYNKI